MSPESRDLENLFGTPPASVPQQEEEEQDFESFFERLSTLDDLTWETGENSTASKNSNRPQGKPLSKRRPESPPMKVLRTPVSRDEPPQAAPRAQKMSTPLKGRQESVFMRILNIIKYSLAGALLFAIGLGGGWLALSIPESSSKDLPWSDVGTTLAKREQETTKKALETREITVKETFPSKKTNQAGARKIKGSAQKKLDGSAPQKGRSVRRDIAAHVKYTTPAPRKLAPHAPVTSSVSKGHFGLQVGACRSASCVDAYKKLLGNLVEPSRIQVVEQSAPEGVIQRIRIEPMEKSAALALKKQLAEQDSRFKRAYLVQAR